MKNRSAIVAGAVGVVVLGLVVVFAMSPAGGDKKVRSPLLGKVPPEISGPELRGGTVDLASYKGEWVLVNFFAPWCPPCKVEHPELRRLSKNDGGPLQILSVGYQDTEKNIREFFEDNGGTWPVLIGDTDQLGIDYGIKQMPESFLISPFGRVVAKFEGAITAKQVLEYIEDSTGGGSDVSGPGERGGS